MGNPFDFRPAETPAAATPGVSDWDDIRAAPATSVAGPPLPFLIGAASTAVLAIVLALVLGRSMPWALAAWVLAGPVAVTLVGLFMSRDVAARAWPVYVSPTWLPWAVRGALVLIGVGVVLSSWRFADWASRL